MTIHRSSDVLIGQSILSYGRHGGRVQEWYKSIHFGVWGGMKVMIFLLVCPFWLKVCMSVVCKNGVCPSIMAFGDSWRL
jgi:hypothetical protein